MRGNNVVGIHPAQFEDFIGRVLHRLNMLLGWAPGTKERVYTYHPADYPKSSSATADVTVQTSVQISSESAFIWTKSMAFVTGQFGSGLAGRAVRDVLIQVQFGGTDQLMTLNPNGAHIENSWGILEQPYVLPKPQFLKAATSLTLRITSISANARECFLDLIGYKVWGADATKMVGTH